MSNTTPFPCYRRLKKTYYNSDLAVGTIVEFTANKEGTVVYSPPNGRYDVGTSECTWIRYDDVKCWEVCDKPDPVVFEDKNNYKWVNAALEMAQFVHAECKDVPHDIGLKLMDIIEKHYTLQ